jgi:hypothetical protein
LAALALYFARGDRREASPLRAIQKKVPLSNVALRNALRTLVEAELIREDKSAKATVYAVADPERLALLATYVERSDPALTARGEPAGMLWALGIGLASDQRRRPVVVGLHGSDDSRDPTSILPDDETADELPATPRHRPLDPSRREQERRA